MMYETLMKAKHNQLRIIIVIDIVFYNKNFVVGYLCYWEISENTMLIFLLTFCKQ